MHVLTIPGGSCNMIEERCWVVNCQIGVDSGQGEKKEEKKTLWDVL